MGRTGPDRTAPSYHAGATSPRAAGRMPERPLRAYRLRFQSRVTPMRMSQVPSQVTRRPCRFNAAEISWPTARAISCFQETSRGSEPQVGAVGLTWRSSSSVCVLAGTFLST